MAETPTPIVEIETERGSVLVIALLFLTLMSLIGATFLTLAGTEGNIATNQEKATQALYVAESGAHVAYSVFAGENFSGFTHDGNGAFLEPGIQLAGSFATELTRDDLDDNGLFDERNDGWYVWQWRPGWPGQGLSGSGLPESYRFSVRPASADPGEDDYVIDVIGTVGRFRRHLQIRGYTESIYSYSYFADGDLADFVEDRDRTLGGRVHANGDLYLRPGNGHTLSITASSLTSTGRMIRTTDAWGRDLFSGNLVEILDLDGNWVEMVSGNPGDAMDSQNASWQSEANDGALALWDGTVRDGGLGVFRVDTPSAETLEPGGLFDVAASIRIRAGDSQADADGNDITATLGDGIREVSFHNAALGRNVTVQEIDVDHLIQSGNWPANGLIYSEVPLRLTNANELQDDLTVVADHSVYTKGDFNDFNKRNAAIVSTGRIWHLSDSWSDDPAVTEGPVSGRQASAGTTTVNAALVDGQPVVQESNYADLDEDGNPDDVTAGSAAAGTGHLLETWGSTRTLVHHGSVAHLRVADMADDLDNDGIAAHEVGWLQITDYTDPDHVITYDSALSSAAGQPPFAFLVSKIYLWQEIAP